MICCWDVVVSYGNNMSDAGFLADGRCCSVAATRGMVQLLMFGQQEMLIEPALDQHKLERKVMKTGQLIPRKPSVHCRTVQQNHRHGPLLQPPIWDD
jgi:hypothetical protein